MFVENHGPIWNTKKKLQLKLNDKNKEIKNKMRLKRRQKVRHEKVPTLSITL